MQLTILVEMLKRGFPLPKVDEVTLKDFDITLQQVIYIFLLTVKPSLMSKLEAGYNQLLNVICW